MARKVLEGPCEAGVGITSEGSSITIAKCHKPGTWYPEGLMPYGIVLCDDCYERLEAKEAKGDGAA